MRLVYDGIAVVEKGDDLQSIAVWLTENTTIDMSNNETAYWVNVVKEGDLFLLNVSYGRWRFNAPLVYRRKELVDDDAKLKRWLEISRVLDRYDRGTLTDEMKKLVAERDAIDENLFNDSKQVYYDHEDNQWKIIDLTPSKAIPQRRYHRSRKVRK